MISVLSINTTHELKYSTMISIDQVAIEGCCHGELDNVRSHIFLIKMNGFD